MFLLVNAANLLAVPFGMASIWDVLYGISVLSFYYTFTLLLLTSLGVDRVGSFYIMYPRKYFGGLLILNNFSWQTECLETNEFGVQPRLSDQASVH